MLQRGHVVVVVILLRRRWNRVHAFRRRRLQGGHGVIRVLIRGPGLRGEFWACVHHALQIVRLDGDVFASGVQPYGQSVLGGVQERQDGPGLPVEVRLREAFQAHLGALSEVVAVGRPGAHVLQRRQVVVVRGFRRRGSGLRLLLGLLPLAGREANVIQRRHLVIVVILLHLGGRRLGLGSRDGARADKLQGRHVVIIVLLGLLRRRRLKPLQIRWSDGDPLA
mmetsp:Transcript_4549/g.13277  ORF Transcript_4549/g.13277 Transcript_4549/m.13277 type:complete len:223 (-) Transcript_4549:838-1506(-)